VACFADQIHDCPMFFTLLQMIQGKCNGFVSSRSTREQQGKQCPIAFPFEGLAIRCPPQRLRLFRCQPVPQAYTQFCHSFRMVDTRCQIGAEEATIGRFVRETAHGSEAEVDCPRASCRDSK